MHHLNRDSILGAPATLRRVEVPVAEWGGSVFVTELDGRRRDELDGALDKHRDKDGKLTSLGTYRAIVAIHTVVDQGGCRLFTVDDLPRLLECGSKPLELVAAVANRLNGLTGDEVEAILKNCGHPLGCGDGCNSPTAGDAQ